MAKYSHEELIADAENLHQQLIDARQFVRRDLAGAEVYWINRDVKTQGINSRTYWYTADTLHDYDSGISKQSFVDKIHGADLRAARISK